MIRGDQTSRANESVNIPAATMRQLLDAPRFRHLRSLLPLVLDTTPTHVDALVRREWTMLQRWLVEPQDSRHPPPTVEAFDSAINSFTKPPIQSADAVKSAQGAAPQRRDKPAKAVDAVAVLFFYCHDGELMVSRNFPNALMAARVTSAADNVYVDNNVDAAVTAARKAAVGPSPNAAAAESNDLNTGHARADRNREDHSATRLHHNGDAENTDAENADDDVVAVWAADARLLSSLVASAIDGEDDDDDSATTSRETGPPLHHVCLSRSNVSASIDTLVTTIALPMLSHESTAPLAVRQEVAVSLRRFLGTAMSSHAAAAGLPSIVADEPLIAAAAPSSAFAAESATTHIIAAAPTASADLATPSRRPQPPSTMRSAASDSRLQRVASLPPGGTPIHDSTDAKRGSSSIHALESQCATWAEQIRFVVRNFGELTVARLNDRLEELRAAVDADRLDHVVSNTTSGGMQQHQQQQRGAPSFAFSPLSDPRSPGGPSAAATARRWREGIITPRDVATGWANRALQLKQVLSHVTTSHVVRSTVQELRKHTPPATAAVAGSSVTTTVRVPPSSNTNPHIRSLEEAIRELHVALDYAERIATSFESSREILYSVDSCDFDLVVAQHHLVINAFAQAWQNCERLTLQTLDAFAGSLTNITIVAAAQHAAVSSERGWAANDVRSLLCRLHEGQQLIELMCTSWQTEQNRIAIVTPMRPWNIELASSPALRPLMRLSARLQRLQVVALEKWSLSRWRRLRFPAGPLQKDGESAISATGPDRSLADGGGADQRDALPQRLARACDDYEAAMVQLQTSYANEDALFGSILFEDRERALATPLSQVGSAVRTEGDVLSRDAFDDDMEKIFYAAKRRFEFCVRGVLDEALDACGGSYVARLQFLFSVKCTVAPPAPSFASPSALATYVRDAIPATLQLLADDLSAVGEAFLALQASAMSGHLLTSQSASPNGGRPMSGGSQANGNRPLQLTATAPSALRPAATAASTTATTTKTARIQPPPVVVATPPTGIETVEQRTSQQLSRPGSGEGRHDSVDGGDRHDVGLRSLPFRTTRAITVLCNSSKGALLEHIVWARAMLKRVQDPLAWIRHVSREALGATSIGCSVLTKATMLTEALTAYDRTLSDRWVQRVEATDLELLERTVLKCEFDSSLVQTVPQAPSQKGAGSRNAQSAPSSRAQTNTRESRVSERLARRSRVDVALDMELFCTLCTLQSATVSLGLPATGRTATILFNAAPGLIGAYRRLERMCQLYNATIELLTPDEVELYRSRLMAVGELLDEGIVKVQWRSPVKDDFINRVVTAVTALHGSVRYVQGNRRVIDRLVHGWRRSLASVWNFSESSSEARKRWLVGMLFGEATSSVTAGGGFFGSAGSGAATARDATVRRCCRKWKSLVSYNVTSVTDVLAQHRRVLRLIEASRAAVGLDDKHASWTAYVGKLESRYARGVAQALIGVLHTLTRILLRGLDPNRARGLKLSATAHRDRVHHTPSPSNGRVAGGSYALSSSASSVLIEMRLELHGNRGAVFSPSIDRDGNNDDGIVGASSIGVGGSNKLAWEGQGSNASASDQPRRNNNAADEFSSMAFSWVNNVYTLARLMPLFTKADSSFLSLVQPFIEYTEASRDVVKVVGQFLDVLEELRDRFLAFRMLWENDAATIIDMYGDGKIDVVQLYFDQSAAKKGLCNILVPRGRGATSSGNAIAPLALNPVAIGAAARSPAAMPVMSPSFTSPTTTSMAAAAATLGDSPRLHHQLNNTKPQPHAIMSTPHELLRDNGWSSVDVFDPAKEAKERQEAERVAVEAERLRRRPTLDDLDAVLARLVAIGDAAHALPSEITWAWLRVDCTPLKTAIARLVREWRDAVIDHIMRKRVAGQLAELYGFMRRVETVLGPSSGALDGVGRSAARVGSVVAAPAEDATTGHGKTNDAQNRDTTAQLILRSLGVGRMGDSHPNSVTDAATASIANESKLSSRRPSAAGGTLHKHDSQLASSSHLLLATAVAAEFTARSDAIEASLQPVVDAVQQLIRHEVVVPVEILRMLDAAPAAWRETKRMAIAAGESISLLTADEVQSVKRRSRILTQHIEQFASTRFAKRFPSSRFDLAKDVRGAQRQAYLSLRECHIEIVDFESKLRALNETEAVFDITPRTTSRVLMQLKLQIVWAKQVWDVAALLRGFVAAWSVTPITLLRVEEVEETVKRVHLQLKDMAPLTRSWPVYKQLEELARSILIVVPLAVSLRHPSFKRKHWAEVAKITNGAISESASEATIEGLLSMKLAEHAAPVSTVIEFASRESHVEKQIDALRQAWQNRRFEFSATAVRGVRLLVVSDELRQTIDEDQSSVQQLETTRHAADFAVELARYRASLKSLETLITRAQEVQSLWLTLVGIFFDSDDLRHQLNSQCSQFSMHHHRLVTLFDWLESQGRAAAEGTDHHRKAVGSNSNNIDSVETDHRPSLHRHGPLAGQPINAAQPSRLDSFSGAHADGDSAMTAAHHSHSASSPRRNVVGALPAAAQPQSMQRPGPPPLHRSSSLAAASPTSAAFDAATSSDCASEPSFVYRHSMLDIAAGEEGNRMSAELDAIYGGLCECDRALGRFLDSKRCEFARFFFLPTPDLLEILSATDIAAVKKFSGMVYKMFPGLIGFEASVSNSNSIVADDSPKTLTPSLQSLAPPPLPTAGGKRPSLTVLSGADVLLAAATLAAPIIGKVDALVVLGGEVLPLVRPVLVRSKAELWLRELTRGMRTTMHDALVREMQTARQMSRRQWVLRSALPGQIALLVSGIAWTADVVTAFAALEDGNSIAMRDLRTRCDEDLQAMIRVTQGPLDSATRTKIINVVTSDVHHRDVVQDLVTRRIDSESHFAWRQQLRHRYDAVGARVFVDLFDVNLTHGMEAIGNGLRLVVTPLTSRIYITLTQALHLRLGGAAAGPAGTGKTETTKDLGGHVGKPVLVFNCSDRMSSSSLSAVLMGLAGSGAWGCLDEFNRISADVLSVLATMLRTLFDAMRDSSLAGATSSSAASTSAPGRRVSLGGGVASLGKRISIAPPSLSSYAGPAVIPGWSSKSGSGASPSPSSSLAAPPRLECELDPSCGIFITMNPGYAGRTDLPDNLKVLFRPVTVVAPDLALICENILMAEGFVDARSLARKFVTLFHLSGELLTKQPQYDWGLRAMKAVLTVAGAMRRAYSASIAAAGSSPRAPFSTGKWTPQNAAASPLAFVAPTGSSEFSPAVSVPDAATTRGQASASVVAGGAMTNAAEEHILMTALREFNLPKIAAHDVSVFVNLVADLFPTVVNRQQQQGGNDVAATFVTSTAPLTGVVGLEPALKAACLASGLSPEDGLFLKCQQFVDLLAVRHSVFVLGGPKTGKSTVWRTVVRALNSLPSWHIAVADLNPKAVSTAELFGYTVPTSTEWRDGLLTHLLRKFANASDVPTASVEPKSKLLSAEPSPKAASAPRRVSAFPAEQGATTMSSSMGASNGRTTTSPRPAGGDSSDADGHTNAPIATNDGAMPTSQQWVVLDGDLDTLWIESLNSVMDDNRVLTLANQERVPIRHSMRLVFEVGTLTNATPATVSRARILLVTERDIGWTACVSAALDGALYQATLAPLFEKYFAPTAEFLSTQTVLVVPIVMLQAVKVVLLLLDAFIACMRTPTEKEIESLFGFCVVWGLGSAMVGGGGAASEYPSATARSSHEGSGTNAAMANSVFGASGGSASATSTGVDAYRLRFDKFVRREWRAVKFPSPADAVAASPPVGASGGAIGAATIFDWWFNPFTKRFEPWESLTASLLERIIHSAAAVIAPPARSVFSDQGQRRSRTEVMQAMTAGTKAVTTNGTAAGGAVSSPTQPAEATRASPTPLAAAASGKYNNNTDGGAASVDAAALDAAWSNPEPLFDALQCQRLGLSPLVPSSSHYAAALLSRLLLEAGLPVMFLGLSGSGKSMMAKWMEQRVIPRTPSPSATAPTNTAWLHMHHYTSTQHIYSIFSQTLERRAGRVFEPPSASKLILIIDDINMPCPDAYGTQAPLAILHHHLDYSHIFESPTWQLKEIRNVHYLACMNPAAGSYAINPRLQSSFFAILLSLPTSRDHFERVVVSSLVGTAEAVGAGQQPQLSPLLRPSHVVNTIAAVLYELHTAVVKTFQKTTVNVHYDFNLRHVLRAVGCIRTAPDAIAQSPLRFCRFLAHELNRVYSDGLVTPREREHFEAILQRVIVTSRPMDVDLEGVNTDTIRFSTIHHGLRVVGPYEEITEDVESILQPGPSTAAAEPTRSTTPSSSADATQRSPSTSTAELTQRVLKQALEEYNDINRYQLSLVFFEEAIAHVLRLVRLINGTTVTNVLFLGPGGSGKASLSRLAGHIGGFDVRSPPLGCLGAHPGDVVTSQDWFRNALSKAGLKNEKVLMVFPPEFIRSPMWLEHVNELLLTGIVSSAFDTTAVDDVVAKLSTEVRSVDMDLLTAAAIGVGSSGSASQFSRSFARESSAAFGTTGSRAGSVSLPPLRTTGAVVQSFRARVWSYFTAKCQSKWRLVVLSALDDTFFAAHRHFPALAHLSVNVFLPWPKRALEDVGSRLLSTATDHVLSKAEAESAVRALAFFHAHTVATAASILEAHGGGGAGQSHNPLTSGSLMSVMPRHLTPRTFVDAVGTFAHLYHKRGETVASQKWRFERGVSMLARASKDIVELQGILVNKQALAEERRRASDDLLVKLSVEKSAVERENVKAAEEASMCRAFQQEVTQQTQECELELVRAEPMLKRAEQALNTLTKTNLTELKSFKAPHADIVNVVRCVGYLLSSQAPPLPAAGGHPTAEASSPRLPNTKLELPWPLLVARHMGRVDVFLANLHTFDKDGMTDETMQTIRPLVTHPSFTADAIVSKSLAAAGLCEWVINIVEYHRVFKIVKPKREAMTSSRSRLEEANARLVRSKAQIIKLKEKMQDVQEAYDAAERDCQEIAREVADCESRLQLAQRFVAATGSESSRWATEAEEYGRQRQNQLGDVLLATGAVVYVTAFGASVRAKLLQLFFDYIVTQACMPVSSQSVDPTWLLASPQEIGKWRHEGLPTDACAAQNAACITQSLRVCLVVDPQVQAFAWLRREFIYHPPHDSNSPAHGEKSGVGTLTRSMSMRERAASVIDALASSTRGGAAAAPATAGIAVPAAPPPVAVELVAYDSHDLEAALLKAIHRGGCVVVTLADGSLTGEATSSIKSPAQNPSTRAADGVLLLHALLRRAYTTKTGAPWVPRHPHRHTESALFNASAAMATASPVPASPLPRKFLVYQGNVIEVHTAFRLILFTEGYRAPLSADIAAEVTLVDFTAARESLEHQLLSLVTRQQRREVDDELRNAQAFIAENALKLKALEDTLIDSLAANSAEGLLRQEVVESTEALRQTSLEVTAKMNIAAHTQSVLAATIEHYRPIARRASLLFFCARELRTLEGGLNHYALSWFTSVFDRVLASVGAIALSTDVAAASASGRSGAGMASVPSVAAVDQAVESITWGILDRILTGLAARHQRPFLLYVALQCYVFASVNSGAPAAEPATNAPSAGQASVRQQPTSTSPTSANELTAVIARVNFFMGGASSLASKTGMAAMSTGGDSDPGVAQNPGPNAVGGLPSQYWFGEATAAQLRALAKVPGFERAENEVLSSSKRWRAWAESATPESERLPGDWRHVGPEFARLIFVRLFRKDRLMHAGVLFAARILGDATLHDRPPLALGDALAETGPATPVLYVLFPGANPAAEVDAVAARRLGGGPSTHAVRHVSLGEGQGELALSLLRHAPLTASSGWLVLHNVHLMPREWQHELDSALDQLVNGPQRRHMQATFRLVLTSEAIADPSRQLPRRLVERCFKLATTPPLDLRSNVVRALQSIPADMLEANVKSAEMKAVAMSLCFFHGICTARKNYCPAGWSKPYAFGQADLSVCIALAHQYLDKPSSYIPWIDLRYMVAEVIYGGHITDPLDRRVCAALAARLLSDDCLQPTFELIPGFRMPPPSHLSQYITLVEQLDGAVVDSELAIGLLVPTARRIVERKNASAMGVARLMLHAGQSEGYGAMAAGSTAHSGSAAAAGTPPGTSAPLLPTMAFNRRGQPNGAAGAAGPPRLKKQPTSTVVAAAETAAAATTLMISAFTSADASSGAGQSASSPSAIPAAVLSRTARALDVIEEMLARLPSDFALVVSQAQAAFVPSNPVSVVLFQEAHNYSDLLRLMRDGISELALALRGKVVFSASHATLLSCLEQGVLPPVWSSKCYPTALSLVAFIDDLLERVKHIEMWASEAASGALPRSIWLGSLYNPSALFTAVLQAHSRKTGVPLDRLVIECEVLKKQPGDITGPPRLGLFVHGLWLDGARWDYIQSCLTVPVMATTAPAGGSGDGGAHNGIVVNPTLQGVCALTVLHLRATPVEDLATKGTYALPVYATAERSTATLCCTLHLRSQEPPSRWLLRGTCGLLAAPSQDD